MLSASIKTFLSSRIENGSVKVPGRWEQGLLGTGYCCYTGTPVITFQILYAYGTFLSNRGGTWSMLLLKSSLTWLYQLARAKYEMTFHL
jgi:hypothetical protein